MLNAKATAQLPIMDPMDPTTYTDPQLTLQDRLVIDALINEPASISEFAHHP